MVKPEPVIRFETDPFRHMQADFATIRRGRDRLSMFIATLGWSRATYVPSVSLLSWSLAVTSPLF